MCCGTPTTLYGTTTITTSYTTLVPTTTTIKPYGTIETVTYTLCSAYSGNACLGPTTSTGVRTADYFATQTKTTTVTQILPLTKTTTYPTATISTPCPSKRDGELMEEFDKRSAGTPMVNSKCHNIRLSVIEQGSGDHQTGQP